MYVTLEPCAHQGRQPPCVEAILEAGIARVVIASEDPSEKAAGRGPGILRDGGVEVDFAAGAEAGRGAAAQPALPQARPHRPAAGHPEAGDVARRPDRDRRPATRPWISGEPSRALVHRWRAESDAIAVGIGTVLADDPLLTARHPRRPPAAPRRLRLPGPPAPRLPAARDPRPVPGPRRRRPRGRPRPRSAPCATPAPRSSSPAARPQPTASTRPSPTSAAAASPASSSRAAGPSPPPSPPPTRSTSPASSSPRCSSAAADIDSRPTAARSPRDARWTRSVGARRRRHPDHGPVQGVVMFTGLIQDVGTVESRRGAAPTAPACGSRPRSAPRSPSATRSPSTASA